MRCTGRKRLIKEKVDQELISLIGNGFIENNKKRSLPEKQTS